MFGYLALSINLYSMYSKGEYKMRLLSALANVTYVIYGLLINAWPIVIGCSIAVIIHLFRIYGFKKTETKT